MQGRARRFENILPGFESCSIEASGARIRLTKSGGGPPLLLLHGYAQTHLPWHKVTPRLAGRFSVVAPGLHGYGHSAMPEGSEGHVNDSKRVVAVDQVEIMHALGFHRCAVVGHDRGGCAAHRTALDHPDVMEWTALGARSWFGCTGLRRIAS